MNLVRNDKIAFYKACIESNNGEIFEKFSFKENKTLLSNLKVGNKIITDYTEISECFNTFFTLIVAKCLSEPNENIPSFTKLQEFIAFKFNSVTLSPYHNFQLMK